MRSLDVKLYRDHRRLWAQSLAIALVAITGAGVGQVVLAIVIADLPRAIRLQRSLALGLKSRAYMDAARMAGAEDDDAGRGVGHGLLPRAMAGGVSPGGRSGSSVALTAPGPRP